MRKIAMILRSTAFSVKGGDTVQAMQTAAALKEHGFEVDIKLTDEKIDYNKYELLHFFNVTRPADIICHTERSFVPYVISTIFIDYSEYDKGHRKGAAGLLFSFLPKNTIEYMKTIARLIKGNDKLMTGNYIRIGQKKSIEKLIKNASLLLPNSDSEYHRLKAEYGFETDYNIIPNGADSSLFCPDEQIPKDEKLVLCVARIEGIKNQLNLIKALNKTAFRLLIIGDPAPNQKKYAEECRKIAAPNISFINHVDQQKLAAYYQKAKVHVLPSWFETTGLSSIEAAAAGCSLVVTDKGDVRSYFEDDAFYCCPSSPESIYSAVEKAAASESNQRLREKIRTMYTWQNAAALTAAAYKTILQEKCS